MGCAYRAAQIIPVDLIYLARFSCRKREQAVEKVCFVRGWMAPAGVKGEGDSLQHERLSASMSPKRSHLKAIFHLLDFTPWCLNALPRCNMVKKNPCLNEAQGCSRSGLTYLAFVAVTVICLGRTSSDLGRVSVRMPPSKLASMCSTSMVVLSLSVRLNGP